MDPHPPIKIVVPDLISRKMDAICGLCRTVEHLARALSDANVTVNISDLNIDASGGGPGISISPETPT